MKKKIIVIGQVDHGKTEFVTCVSRIMEGSFKNSDENNNSNETCYTLNGTEFCMFDYAGNWHYEERVTGEEDMAILICSLADGPMPYTKKHLEICKEKGIEKVAVFFTMADFVDDESLIALIEEEVFAVMEERGYAEPEFYEIGSPYAANEKNDEKEIKRIKKFLLHVAEMLA